MNSNLPEIHLDNKKAHHLKFENELIRHRAQEAAVTDPIQNHVHIKNDHRNPIARKREKHMKETRSSTPRKKHDDRKIQTTGLKEKRSIP